MSPQILDPIPMDVPIVNEDGAITIFMRERWQQLITSFQVSPTVARVQALAQHAAIATVAAFTTKQAGLYEVTYYLRKTTADGVTSSLTFTWGWTEGGVPFTASGAALTLDATSAVQSGSMLLPADAATDLSYAVSYASNTPGLMAFRVDVIVKLAA